MVLPDEYEPKTCEPCIKLRQEYNEWKLKKKKQEKEEEEKEETRKREREEREEGEIVEEGERVCSE